MQIFEEFYLRRQIVTHGGCISDTRNQFQGRAPLNRIMGGRNKLLRIIEERLHWSPPTAFPTPPPGAGLLQAVSIAIYPPTEELRIKNCKQDFCACLVCGCDSWFDWWFDGLFVSSRYVYSHLLFLSRNELSCRQLYGWFC